MSPGPWHWPGTNLDIQTVMAGWFPCDVLQGISKSLSPVTYECLDSRDFFWNFTSRSWVIFISLSILDLDFQSFSIHFHFSISISSKKNFTFTSRKEWMAFFLHFSLLGCPKPTLAGHCITLIKYLKGQKKRFESVL